MHANLQLFVRDETLPFIGQKVRSLGQPIREVVSSSEGKGKL